jgi:hypothetical protein
LPHLGNDYPFREQDFGCSHFPKRLPKLRVLVFVVAFYVVANRVQGHVDSYAFDATKLGQPIYTSEQDSARDRAALATRFVIPLVANGRVYVGTRSEVEVYGLLK